jgi:DNA-directed RNA polymerase subunit RPC12/RpoP
MLRTYDFVCSTCSKKQVLLVEQEERDSPQPCSCGSNMHRTFSPPIIRTAKTSTSFVDGQRARSKEWQDMRTQEALEDRVHEAGDFGEKIEATVELQKFKESTAK